jgi:hypothetical protein
MKASIVPFVNIIGISYPNKTTNPKIRPILIIGTQIKYIITIVDVSSISGILIYVKSVYRSIRIASM